MSLLSDAALPAAHDPESRVHDEHHETLRLWLRLLTCTLTIEGRIRARLRDRFATTLPRFDLMAQLERHPAGLRMGELSQRLMVTGGSVTGITDQLVAEGLVVREDNPADRRAYIVKLTPEGRRAFKKMADAHRQWIVELFGGISEEQRGELHELLAALKQQLAPPRKQ